MGEVVSGVLTESEEIDWVSLVNHFVQPSEHNGINFSMQKSSKIQVHSMEVTLRYPKNFAAPSAPVPYRKSNFTTLRRSAKKKVARNGKH